VTDAAREACLRGAMARRIDPAAIAEVLGKLEFFAPAMMHAGGAGRSPRSAPDAPIARRWRRKRSRLRRDG
jgi:uncharacterized membrane protein YraQ (UPF0718 family)